jgi:hypothetical protein
MAAPDREPRAPKARPDPGPMRLTLAMTGFVAATAMATAIIRPPAPAPAATPDPVPQPTDAPTQPPLVIRRVTQYVQLKPGETAPPGATVVQKPAASPRVVVVTIPAPPAKRVVVTQRVVAVTRQSGGK